MNEQISRLFEFRRLEDRTKSGSYSKIVSVCSGKGGTGKTFFSLNFAYQLSRNNKKVLIVDLDFNFSNLHLLLNHTTEKPLSNFFLHKYTLHEVIFKYSDNLHFIFGESGLSGQPKIGKDLVDYFFMQLDKIAPRYDIIVLDSAAGSDEATLHQLSRSDYNIVIASPEPTAVMDAYVVFKMIAENSDRYKNFLVVNKTENNDDGESAYQNLSTAVRHFLKSEITLLGTIASDRNVYKSILEQDILMKLYPNSLAALEISELTRRFLKITQMANNNQSLIFTLF